MKNNKTIDAVKMMRNIRDRHYALYKSNPGLREERLAEIRKRYAHKIKQIESIGK